MKTHYLAVIPAAALMIACGGSSTPEPETPANEKTETATPKGAAEEGAETPEQEKAEEAKDKSEKSEKSEAPDDDDKK